MTALRENVPLAAHTTLGLGGPARYWADVAREAELPEVLAWAGARRLAVLVLGAGSNVLASDGGFAGLALHLALEGEQETGAGRVRVAAGENWDAVVARGVVRGWAGVECLSGIPGSVGATPVQNVGAYGQEVAEVITQVRAWDRREHVWVELTAAECGFGYRASRFNAADRGRFVITAVEFQLHPGGAARLRYPELRQHIRGDASLTAVREAVLALRRGKAMVLDPGEPDSRSAGSFFKNPVLSLAEAEALDARADGARPPQFTGTSGSVKISAAWLIEHAGIGKGFRLPASGIHVSTKHVLALVNDGRGTAAEVMALAEHIRSTVAARWGVRLELEPVAVGF
ncbi:MAG: UDP-N-acetylmuramate dehydrogenase [Acidobacteria bacterium]|nr:MAG: UDP-N-acetylmuramate dehydrogenase [Acidobacteriota bacterium]